MTQDRSKPAAFQALQRVPFQAEPDDPLADARPNRVHREARLSQIPVWPPFPRHW